MFVWGHGEITGLKARQELAFEFGVWRVHVDYCVSILYTIESDFGGQLAPQYTAHKCQILSEREVRYQSPKEENIQDLGFC